MMNFKKPFALVLAVVLGTAALAGCASTPQSYLTDENGKPIQVEKIATINGEDISLEEFRYYFLSTKAYYEQMLSSMTPVVDSGEQPSIWDTSPEMLTAVKEEAISAIQFDRVLRQFAADNKIELTAEDKAGIDENVKSSIEQSGGAEEYKKALEDMFMTEALYRGMLENQALQNKVQSVMTAEGSRLAPTADEIKTHFEANYLHAKHILVSTDGITDEAEIAKKKELADKALERAKAGEDFDALVKEYGEDPGMQNSPEGYYFTDGEMVPEFYEGTKALKDNEISGLVQTDYGWHIIQRLPLGDYYEQNKGTLQADIAASQVIPKLNEELKAMMDACVVEKTPEYELINAANLK